MQKTALFTYNYGKEKMKEIEELGYNVILKPEKDLEYSNELEDVEVLICYNPFETLDISKMKNLKWIQLSSIGVDQVQKEKAVKQNIIVSNNKGGYSIAISEWVISKILELCKHSYKFYKNKENKIWKMDTSLLELYGKTVGIIGTGTIGIETAKRLKPFGVNVFGVNTTGRKVEFFDKCFAKENTNEMLKECDIVVVLIPGTEETYHFVNERSFSAMKDGVFFINAARGSVVDERALIKNIQNKKIKGAALDVFEKEPLAEDSPFWNFENVIINPHNSWISEMKNVRKYNIIYENMKRYISGQKLLNVVDLYKGY